MMKISYSIVYCNARFPVDYFEKNYHNGMLLDRSLRERFDIEIKYIASNELDREKCVYLATVCGECGITFSNDLAYVCETYVIDCFDNIVWCASIENHDSILKSAGIENNKHAAIKTLNDTISDIRSRINVLAMSKKYPIVREQYFYVNKRFGIRNVSDNSNFYKIDLEKSINVTFSTFNKFFIGEDCSLKYFLDNTDYGDKFDFDVSEIYRGICVTEDGCNFSFIVPYK